MSITAKQLIELTRYRIPGGIDSPKVQTYAFQVGSWLPTALNRLTDRICRSNDQGKIGLLTKDFNMVALSSGVADLSGSTYDNILLEHIPGCGVILHSSNSFPLQWVNSETELLIKQPMQALFIHYTINGRRLITKNTDGSLTSLSGTMTMKTPAVPGLTQSGNDYLIDMPPQLVDDAVDILQEMFTEKLVPEEVDREGTEV